MAPNLKMEEDFADLSDGLESVELRRLQSAERVTVDIARRIGAAMREATPGGGFVRQADAVWHLQMPGDERAPGPGDVVVDGIGGHWTILIANELPLLGRWKCETRDLSVAYGCLNRVGRSWLGARDCRLGVCLYCAASQDSA